MWTFSRILRLLSIRLHQLVSELDPCLNFFQLDLRNTTMDVEASQNQRLQLVEASVEEIWKGFSEMQQSLTQITDLLTWFNIQPIGENPRRNEALWNPPARNSQARNHQHQELQDLPSRNQAANLPVQIHNNQLYGNHFPCFMVDDSKSSEVD